MASIKRRRGKYHVVYYYLNEDGEKKQNGNRLIRRQKRNTAKLKLSTNKAPELLLPPAKRPLPRSLRIL